MVAADGVDDLFLLAVSLAQVGADLWMAALDLVVHGLSDIVQQAAAPGGLAVEAKFLGDDLPQVGDLHGMLQHVLSIAGAEVQPPQQIHKFTVQPADVGLHGGLLAVFGNLLVDFLLGGGDDLLDAGRMDPPVLDEFLQRAAGNFPPHRIETGYHHDSGGIVNDNVHAGGLLESSDVAALAPDDAAFHVIGGNIHRRDGGVAGVLGGIALNGGDDDLAGLRFGCLTGLVEAPIDDPCRLVLHVLLHAFQQHGAGLVHGKVRHTQQLRLLLGDQVVHLAVPVGQGFFFFHQGPFGRLGHALLGVDGFQLSIDDVLALGQSLFLGAKFLAHDFGFGVGFFTAADKLGLGLRFGLGEDLLGLGLCRCTQGGHLFFHHYPAGPLNQPHHHGGQQHRDDGGGESQCGVLAGR